MAGWEEQALEKGYCVFAAVGDTCSAFPRQDSFGHIWDRTGKWANLHSLHSCTRTICPVYSCWYKKWLIQQYQLGDASDTQSTRGVVLSLSHLMYDLLGTLMITSQNTTKICPTSQDTTEICPTSQDTTKICPTSQSTTKICPSLNCYDCCRLVRLLPASQCEWLRWMHWFAVVETHRARR